MSARPVAATRLNLLRTKRRLERLDKGADLLRRKREALVTELFRLARPAADARRQIADAAAGAYPLLLQALAAHGAAGLRAIGWPPRDLRVEVIPRTVWGLVVSAIAVRQPVPRTLGVRGMAPRAPGSRRSKQPWRSRG